MFNPWIFLQAKIPKGHPWVKSSFQLHHEFKLAEFMVNRHKQTQPPKFQKEGFAQICFTHKTNKKTKCEDSGAVPNGWFQDMLVSYALPVPNIPNLAGQPSSSPLDASSNLRKTSAKGNSWNRFQERWKRTRFGQGWGVPREWIFGGSNDQKRTKMMGVDAKNEFWKVFGYFFQDPTLINQSKSVVPHQWGTNGVRHDCVSTADRMTGNQNLCVSHKGVSQQKRVAFCRCVLVTLWAKTISQPEKSSSPLWSYQLWSKESMESILMKDRCFLAVGRTQELWKNTFPRFLCAVYDMPKSKSSSCWYEVFQPLGP